MDILLLLVAAGVGIGVGYAVFANRGKDEHERSKVKAEKAVAEAEAKAKELTLKAQEDVLRAKESSKNEEAELRKRLSASEARVATREETLDEKEKQLDGKREQLDADREQTRKLKEEIEQVKERQVQNLEKVSKLTQAKAKDVLLKMVEKDFSADLARKAKEIEVKATEEAEQRAKKIIAGAIQRYAADQSAELTVTTVKIPNDDVKGRIIGKEGRNIQALEKATGVDIIVDDTPDTVVISGYNQVRRQVARLSMEKLVADGRINPSRIEEVVTKSEKEINQITKKAGEDALYELKLSGINPDLTKLLGTMKFRTSYGQNILKHSVEVSFIAQMLAGELGVDATKAKLAGLFHDIGKAVTHEVEGPHALIGRDICKKYGLPEDVCHAVGAHHEDLPIDSTLDVIAQVADAISGARPGSRRESFEQYVKRLTELENVANGFDGVEKAYAIQAGREVRIIVKPEEVDDLSTLKLAKDVARKIEKEMTFPGQITVNVLRETKATEVAK
ncbi:MAG: ribonuclease Y [Patescibacteria group bacterium]|nr:ribonuclease Y [Patescibacteria group bacterium]